MRFRTEEIAEVSASGDTVFVIELKDGRLFKMRKSQMDKEELDQVVRFFLQ